MAQPSGGRFAQLIAPLSVDRFLSEVFDTVAWHAPAASRGGGGDVHYDLARFDAALSRAALPTSHAFAIDATRALTTADYSHADGTADVARLLDLYDQGATLVLREADRVDSALWRLCRACERALEAPAFANVYLAPPGGAAFAIHYDALDVFALQCAGTKAWTLYHRAGPAPLRHQHCYGGMASGEEDHIVTLAPGDLLYVPRGVPHRVAAGDAPSLHVTISVTPFTVHDRWQAGFALLDQHPGAHRAALLPTAADPAEDAVTLAPPPRWRRDALLRQSPALIEAPLARRVAAAALTDATLIAADPDLPRDLRDAGDHWQLTGQGRSIGFAPAAGAALAAILSDVPVRIADLPGLDDPADRIDLVATLVRYGFASVLS